MRKILVITYCTSSNPGTFLQAFGVKTGLKKLYPNADIEYLKAFRPDGKHKKKQYYAGIQDLISVTYGRFLSMIRNKKYLKWSNKYYKCAKSENLTCWDYNEDKYKRFISNYDLVVIGSDTILDRMVNNGKIGLMWGCANKHPQQILFAASGDDCEYLKSNKQFFPQIEERLNHFSFLGIRDNMIKDFFETKLNISPAHLTLQPDPTYLLPLSTFKLSEHKRKKIKKQNKKLIFFHIDRLFKYRAELASLLKSLGYLLISPDYDPNCDINMGIITPFEWGDTFRHIDIVITERFHDTIFALRHCKPVINIDWKCESVNSEGKSKRTEILSLYGLDEYNINLTEGLNTTEFARKMESLIKTFNVRHVSKKNEELIELSYNILREIAERIKE